MVLGEKHGTNYLPYTIQKNNPTDMTRNIYAFWQQDYSFTPRRIFYLSAMPI